MNLCYKTLGESIVRLYSIVFDDVWHEDVLVLN